MDRRRLAVLAIALTLAGCTRSGGASPDTSGSPSASAAASAGSDARLCADVVTLRASLDRLKNVTVTQGMTNEIKADLQQLKADLSTFVRDAGGRWQVQVEALQAAIATLGTAVDNLAASPSTISVSAVQAARGAVVVAGQNLIGSIDLNCASASPSPSG